MSDRKEEEEEVIPPGEAIDEDDAYDASDEQESE